MVRNDRDLASKDVQEAGEDENVSDKRCCAQSCKIADEREREEDDELHEDEVRHGDQPDAVSDGKDECLQRRKPLNNL